MATSKPTIQWSDRLNTYTTKTKCPECGRRMVYIERGHGDFLECRDCFDCFYNMTEGTFE